MLPPELKNTIVSQLGFQVPRSIHEVRRSLDQDSANDYIRVLDSKTSPKSLSKIYKL
jgi:hypothetical protein